MRRQSIIRTAKLGKAVLSSGGALAAFLIMAPASAQDSSGAIEAEDDENYDNIIVTGTKIRQGGAQDIRHFRSVSLDGSKSLPRPSSLTLEGLLGEHDLTLPAQSACEKLFCINAQSMTAQLPAQPDSTVFLGLGFESGIDAKTYQDRPLSLIAVVDRSGSMSGAPITKVKEGLHAALAQMGEGDRIGIVIYGSETNVHLPVMDVVGNRERIAAAIDSIAINGSTYMEAGLKLGYATAHEELAKSNGDTRLMLFSDENANVGNTSPEGFMGQAHAGAEAGIGLTSIGVGRIFDGRLASKISSVKGGNLFFVDREGDATKLFEREFDNMVSEVARDIRITIDPADGFTIADLYGVPENILTRNPDGSVSAFIGSAFLSSNGGGIFASLSGTGDFAAPASVAITYEDALSGERGHDAVTVASVDDSPPETLRLAQTLVDQYTVMHSALTDYHRNNDPYAAEASLAALSERMRSTGLAGLGGELTLVDGLRKSSAEIIAYNSSDERMRLREVLGEWEVLRHRGVTDLSRGDFVEINESGQFLTERNSGRDTGDSIWQSYEINEKQLYIVGSGLVMHYQLKDDTLRLRNRKDRTLIVLKRRTDS